MCSSATTSSNSQACDSASSRILVAAVGNRHSMTNSTGNPFAVITGESAGEQRDAIVSSFKAELLTPLEALIARQLTSRLGERVDAALVGDLGRGPRFAHGGVACAARGRIGTRAPVRIRRLHARLARLSLKRT